MLYVTILSYYIIMIVTLPAGIALNNYPNVQGKPVHCSFKGISACDKCYINSVNSVVNGIFPITMKVFQEKEALRPWLK